MELKLEHISKEYKNTTALDDFSMTFSEGIYGLLGPNGAGKSTLMKLITRNIKPTTGEIYLDETNIHDLKREYQRLIGYMPQQQGYYADLSVLYRTNVSCLHGAAEGSREEDAE